ncbi:MAG: hypothetical protein GW886_13935 [Rhodobacterales bacterium]|nr:hypothetical protein [Rhodobacterales bacterium]
MKHLALPLILLLAACGGDAAGPGSSGTISADPSLQPLFPVLPPPADDTCGAARNVTLIGRSETSLRGAALPEGARVVAEGAPMTRDFRAGRLNIVIGPGNLANRMFCG